MNDHQADARERLLELFLDGELTDGEMESLRASLADDEGLRTLVREDLVLRSALEEAGEAAFIDDLGTTGSSNDQVLAWRRWARVAVAAAMLLLAFFLGREWPASSQSSSSSDMSTSSALSVGDLIVADAADSRDVLVGSARVRVRPGARARVISLQPASLTLEQGGIEVGAEDGEVHVTVDGFGSAFISGECELLRASATPRRDAYLMMTSFSGAARLVDGEFTDVVEPGEPRLFDGGGPRLTGDVLARLAEIEGDEGLLVLTTDEHTELLSSLDDDKERLQVRVAELMEERERLSVELAALKRRTPDRDLSIEELVRTTAELAEKEGLAGRDRARWWRRIRAVRGRAGRRQVGELVSIIERELLDEAAGDTRQQLGLWFLSQLRSRSSATVMRRFVGHDLVALRLAAVEGLARQKDQRLRRELEEIWRRDVSVVVRIAAAGGLVTLGDHGEPLQWLLKQYLLRPRHPEGLRRRIFARVLAAPLSASKASRYIVALCLDESAPLSEQREVVMLLARLGSKDAEDTLAFLAESAARRQIRGLARRRLDAIEGR